MIAIKPAERVGRRLGLIRKLKVVGNFAADRRSQRIGRSKFRVVTAVIECRKHGEQGFAAVKPDEVVALSALLSVFLPNTQYARCCYTGEKAK